jgi:heptosyltransferase-2/heptosyltransferase-3
MRLSRLLNLASAFGEIALSRAFPPKAKPPMNEEERLKIRQILVFGYFGLGDAVMILPSLRALQELFPNATLDFIGSGRTAAYHVLKLSELFSAMHFFEFKDATLRERRQMNRFLAKQGYDCIFCSYTAPIEHFVPFLKTVPHRAGHTLAVKNARKTRFRPDWLLQYPAELQPDEQIHETERYARIVRALAEGANVLTNETTFRFFTDTTTAKIGTAKAAATPRIAIHAAVSPLLAWKNWGTERFIELGKRLAQEYSAEITLLGDASERELLEQMAKEINGNGTVQARVSTPRPGDHSTESLAETCRVLLASDVFVGNESGVGHIAMALGVRAVRIFGMTDYASFRTLNADKHADIRKDLPCSPCFVLGQIKQNSLNMTNCGHRNCLHTITVDEVFAAVAQKITLAGFNTVKPS